MRMLGLDLIGAVTTIPTAGADYTDAKTVAAVQQALVSKHYDCGTTGPKHDGVDGVFGRNTKNAIMKMQADVGLAQTGRIDEGVIVTLRVTPGVLPPGVSLQDNAALQAQVALDAATAADHAGTPDQLQTAAQQAVDAAPPLPPEVRQQALDALKKAKAASTPAEVKAAAQDVKAAAQQVHETTKPSWFVQPAWPGGWERWKVGLVALFATMSVGGLGYAVVK